MKYRNKVKRLKPNEYRVISIGANAVRELLLETFTDKAGEYFDLLDPAKVVLEMSFNSETGGLICAVHDADNSRAEFPNFAAMAAVTGETTQKIFEPNRYATVEEEERGVFKLK